MNNPIEGLPISGLGRQAKPPTEKGRVSRPTLEVADIFRAQGSNFIDRHRTTVRFQQLKVMRAPSCIAGRQLSAVMSISVRDVAATRPISYNSCRNRPTAQNVKLKRASVGSTPESRSFYKHAISMSCSRCRMSCTRSSCKTKPNSTIYCSVRSPTPS